MDAECIGYLYMYKALGTPHGEGQSIVRHNALMTIHILDLSKVNPRVTSVMRVIPASPAERRICTIPLDLTPLTRHRIQFKCLVQIHFQNRIIMFCLPISAFMYLWAIYIFPGSVCLFGCSKIGRPILEIYVYKLLTYTWMLKLGDRTL